MVNLVLDQTQSYHCKEQQLYEKPEGTPKSSAASAAV